MFLAEDTYLPLLVNPEGLLEQLFRQAVPRHLPPVRSRAAKAAIWAVGLDKGCVPGSGWALAAVVPGGVGHAQPPRPAVRCGIAVQGTGYSGCGAGKREGVSVGALAVQN